MSASRLWTSVVVLVLSCAAWKVSGEAVAFALAVGAVATGIAALIDARTSRIPNRLVVAVVAVSVVSVPLVSVFDDRSAVSVGMAAVGGVVYSGAPLLFLIWLVRPASIGGGDWKLVAVLGAILGLALPFAALVMTTAACVVQISYSVVRRSQLQPFAPSLAVGYVAALFFLPVLSSIFGGAYA